MCALVVEGDPVSCDFLCYTNHYCIDWHPERGLAETGEEKESILFINERSTQAGTPVVVNGVLNSSSSNYYCNVT